jgi:hypothetical protein
MEGKNPREGCAALVLGRYHQRRAGVARIRQTWLPTGRIRQPDEASQRRAWHGVEVRGLPVAAFGDDTTAVLFYYPHTANVSDAPTAECFTLADGKITRSVLVFDRPSFAPPQR